MATSAITSVARSARTPHDDRISSGAHCGAHCGARSRGRDTGRNIGRDTNARGARGASTSSASTSPQQPVELHFTPTPNGWKVTIMLEEAGIPYTVVPVNLERGEQHTEAFRALSPNGRMPALVDPNVGSGGLSVYRRPPGGPCVSEGQQHPRGVAKRGVCSRRGCGETAPVTDV